MITEKLAILELAITMLQTKLAEMKQIAIALSQAVHADNNNGKECKYTLMLEKFDRNRSKLLNFIT